MIINTGQRTDIPAFYSEWFINRILEGYVYVRNPYYPKRITKYIFNPEVVDCICFCSKNPKPMLDKLDALDGYRQLWYITITGYGKSIEPHVPHYLNVIESFKILSLKHGKKRVIWRYDPIFIDENYHFSYHLRTFEVIAKKLSGYCEICVLSFIDLYEKCKKNFSGVKEVDIEMQHKIVKAFLRIAKQYGIKIYMCAESEEFKRYGVNCDGCMSQSVIENALDLDLYPTSFFARKECSCLLGNDIGAYNTCMHGCLYCYANINKEEVISNHLKHDVHSPLLIGHIKEDDKITIAKQDSLINRQISLEL